MPAMSTDHEAPDEAQVRQVVETFHRNGFGRPGFVTRRNLRALRRSEELMDDPRLAGTEFLTSVGSAMVLRFASPGQPLRRFADAAADPATRRSRSRTAAGDVRAERSARA